MRGVLHPKEAKAMAIREALSWLKTREFDFIQIEYDALQVLQCLNTVGLDSSFDLILLDIKDLISCFTHLLISFAK